MNRTIITICLAMLLMSLGSCTSTLKEQTITGTIKGLGTNPIVLLNEEKVPIDTVEAINDTFVFKHQIDLNDPKFHGVTFPLLSEKGSRMIKDRTYFFVDSDAIQLTATIAEGGLEDIVVTGSPATTKYDDLNANFPANIEIKKYEQSYMEAFNKYNYGVQNDENRKQLSYYSSIIDSLMGMKRQNMLDAISINDKSVAMAAMFYFNFRNEPVEFLEKHLAQFSPELQNTYYLKQLYTKIALKKSSSVGSMAPDFELMNANGEMVKLSSFKGRYVLIDFWASWCGPCIREVPHLKKVYEKFKDHGLEIISVSIDDKENAWRKALDKHQLPYVKLWDDTKVTQDLYQFTGIPYVVLVNPEGDILQINKGLRGDDLETTLEALFR